jgi:PIN domain nuclease of toxin-antitoxin system
LVGLLLDSHALLWWWAESPSLSKRAQAAIEDAGVEVRVSAASAWELGFKQRLGKLGELSDSIARFHELMKRHDFLPLSVSIEHGLRASTYAAAHRDPFDRLLAAQAELEGLTLVTRDPAFAAFPIQTLW